MKTTLVIMAAGLGSRYGGNKQTEGIGPNHEMLMEYSLYDALRAGFDKFIFVIKPDMQQLIETLCGELLQTHPEVEVHYAIQDFSSVPSFYQVPASRTKPFGTVHAVLCATKYINEPFAVINADDFYGADAYASMCQYLQSSIDGEASMVAYYLKNTVSANGAVTRGVCKGENGILHSITETFKILPFPDGTIRDTSKCVEGEHLDVNALVSMNFWGFHPSIAQALQSYFDAFLHAIPAEDIKAECLLPVMVDTLMQQQKLTVRILSTDAVWFGMTYPADKPFVQQSLKALHDNGTYPETLIG